MEKLFPESLVDFETIVSPISSESRTASSTGIHKNRNTNRVKATESVLWSNRGDSSVKIDQPTVPITNNSNSTLTESIQEDKVQEICQNKVNVPRKKGIKRRQVQIGPNIDEDKAIQQNDSINEHGINECACYPAEFCAMKGLDVSKSLHKCCKCHAKIFAVCAPQFEETSEVRCRHCTISNNITAQPKEINKKIIDKKHTKHKKKRRDIKNEDSDSDSDQEDVSHKTSITTLPSRNNVRRSMSRTAAIRSTSKSAELFDGAKNYHDEPHLLFQSQIHRLIFCHFASS